MTAVSRIIADGLVNLATRLGSSSDKTENSSYVPRILSDQEVEDAFRTSWIIKKTIRVPALDATRRWRQWHGPDAGEIRKVEDAPRIQLKKKLHTALWMARLYGGAGILIGTDARDFSVPLDPERESLEFLTTMGCLQLTAGQLEDDATSENYGRPREYIVSTRQGTMYVHWSRVVRLVGEEVPPWGLSSYRNSGWGDSLLQSIYDTCRNLDSTMGNIAALVFDAKTDIVKIPGLTEQITNPRFEDALLARFSAARMLKGNQGILMLDGEEEYESKNYNFGGLDTIADRFMQVASGAADIPMTRLLGMSPAGMNSTGESDLLNYYDRVSSMQNTEIQPELRILDDLIVRRAGLDPDEQEFTWRSLRQMTEEQTSAIRKQTAETIKVIAETRVYGDDEIARVGSEMFADLGILLKDTADDLPPEEPPATTTTNDARPRTLYVSRPVVNADEVLQWAREQGIQNTLPASELHVTIAFSRTPVDWMKTGESYATELTVPEGGARLVERLGAVGDATVLMFTSSELSWRHHDITDAGASWDWPDYQPHVTISYDPEAPTDVEPYLGRIVLGPEVFREVDEDWKEKIPDD